VLLLIDVVNIHLCNCGSISSPGCT